ncbi:hypothetical protein GI582_17525 [Sulfitobacter sp. BDSS02]|nr:hypothetical protein [Sulfitobacter sp. BDSS02]MBR9850828.1 hypothetical protein [Paracoccaceae bacterium]
MSIGRILSFWARTAPKTPMQRIGAVLMGVNTVLCTSIILMTIADASANAWTGSGIAGSVVGIGVILLLLPIGLAHMLAAFLPYIFDPWRRIDEVKVYFADRIRDMYLVFGWFALVGAVVLLAYLLSLRLL